MSRRKILSQQYNSFHGTYFSKIRVKNHLREAILNVKISYLSINAYISRVGF